MQNGQFPPNPETERCWIPISGTYFTSGELWYVLMLSSNEISKTENNVSKPSQLYPCPSPHPLLNFYFFATTASFSLIYWTKCKKQLMHLRRKQNLYHWFTVLTNWIRNLHRFWNIKFQFGNFKLGNFCPRLLKKHTLLGSDSSFALN